MEIGRLIVHALSRSTEIASGIFIEPLEAEITRAEWERGRSECAYNGDIVPRFCAARAALRNNTEIISDPSTLELALVVSKQPRPSVLDFGGGAGVHYQTLTRMGFDFSRYVVVETEQMTDAAKAAGLNGATFTERTPSDAFDIVFSAGALQSTDDPLKHLTDLAEKRATHLLLTRNAFSDETRYFKRTAKLFDHGSGPIPEGFEQTTVEHYSQTLPYDAVMQIIERRYHVAMRVQNTSGMPSGAEGVFGVDLICELT